ncbi:MAG TPA: two-component regulator propeller domain-containing protein [Thermoanaerobaculia bacterium]|nr:two-component regulator propeller domain-containing protein [Thermoanaerobaculia bacterium]
MRILSLAALLGLAAALAQASTSAPLDVNPDYVHEVFTLGDGLPLAGLSQALRTRDGFLWLATYDGLVRFDGVRFEVFDSERVPALGSNRIADLVEARDGALWIRTEQGHLARYADGELTSCAKPQKGRAPCDSREAGPAWYTMLSQDKAGKLWVGGRSGLFQAEGGGLRELPGTDTGTGARFLLQDRRGTRWVVSLEGIWSARPGKEFDLLDLPPGALAYGAPSMAEDGEGELWIATSNGSGRLHGSAFVPEIPGWGFVIEDGRGEVLLSTPDRLMVYRGGVEVEAGEREGLETILRETAPGTHRLLPGRSICIGPHGDEWIAWRNTLYRNGSPVLRLPSALDTFNSVFLDGDGSLWITTSRSGELHALHPARLTTIAEGLPSPNVFPVYEDRDGTILAGGYEFIAALAPGARRFQPRPGLTGPQQTVMSFLRDRAGRLWVGTTRGLFVQAGNRFEPVGDEALHTTAVRALYEDTSGVLWVGTERGIARRDPGGPWSWILPEDGLPFPWIRVIRETEDGSLWFGTNGGGVIRLRDGRFTSVTTAQGLSSDVVRSIWVAPDGRLWIGTESRGLNRLDPRLDPKNNRIAVLGERQGLYSNGIHQIVPDAFGNLWMSSNRGLFRARLRDLDAAADGGRPWVETLAYTERDGMRVREANGGTQDAGFRDRSGRIWFPTHDGVVRIDPRAALKPGRPAQAHVVRLRAGAEEIPVLHGAVRLTPAQRSFAVELSAPSFQESGRQRFRYRMTPYDHDWIEAGTAREAVYTKVPPGRYVFEVAAGPSIASVRVEVVPRFFETRLFLAACILAALSVAAAGVRLWGVRQRARQRDLERLIEERTATIAEQAEKLRELDRLKSQFFANVSHELRTPLTLTLGPLRDSLDGRFGPLREEVAGQVRLALRNAERLLGLVDQLLDVARLDAGRLKLRPRRGDLAALVRQRVEAFLPLAERRRIELSLEAPAEPVIADFDEAQLEKVFDNLLVNALKFTPEGGGVKVTLVSFPDEVEVSVEDDGPGIPADRLDRVFERFYQAQAGPGAGIGLSLARQLVELHQGSIAVASEPGRGARFTVRLKRRLPEPDSGPLPGAPRPLSPAPLDLDDTRTGISDGEPEPDQDRTTVLVVDDNADMRAYVRRHLEPDYRVIEAADGVQGLERARSFLPDLVVSDVMMPGLDGNALFRSLREDPELDLVPVILLTAKASAENRIQGLRDGVDDYLVKPFDPRELKARVDNLLASRRRLLERIGATPEIPPSAPRPLRVSEVQVTPADESLLARVQAAIEERLGDPELTVESLAAALGCERSYLLRKLRTLAGESPSGLIRSLRLQRAEQLLRAGAGSVGEIAYSVGFKSVAHFSNAFQERYGERPSAFAARHRAR